MVAGANCPLIINQAINAKFNTVKVGGIKSASLQFTVPDNLLHNNGLDVSVASVSSTVSKIVKRVRVHGKKRKVGILSSYKCKGKKRTIQVTFTDEPGSTVPKNRKVGC